MFYKRLAGACDICFLKNISSRLKYPVVVKPANLGSSIGVVLAETEEEVEVYLQVMMLDFQQSEDGYKKDGGISAHMAVTFQKDGGEYRNGEVWLPQSGTENMPSIKAKFSDRAYEQVEHYLEYSEELQKQCYRQAEEHFS